MKTKMKRLLITLSIIQIGLILFSRLGSNVSRVKVNVQFKWFDIWQGLYVDAGHRAAYLCLFPMIANKIVFPRQAFKGVGHHVMAGNDLGIVGKYYSPSGRRACPYCQSSVIHEQRDVSLEHANEHRAPGSDCTAQLYLCFSCYTRFVLVLPDDPMKIYRQVKAAKRAKVES